MKRATSIICAFCMGLFISIGILACAVDDYAMPNANNPSSDLQLCKIEKNHSASEYEHAIITYGSDGRISSMTFINHHPTNNGLDTFHHESTINITYNQNKIIIPMYLNYDVDFTFNNELRYYSAETINNQVFNCLTMIDLF